MFSVLGPEIENSLKAGEEAEMGLLWNVFHFYG